MGKHTAPLYALCVCRTVREKLWLSQQMGKITSDRKDLRRNCLDAVSSLLPCRKEYEEQLSLEKQKIVKTHVIKCPASNGQD